MPSVLSVAQTRELPLMAKKMTRSEMQTMCVGTAYVVLNFVAYAGLAHHVHRRTLVYVRVRPV